MIQPTLDGEDGEPHLVVSNQFRVCAECDGDIHGGDKYGRTLSGDVVCAACAPRFAIAALPVNTELEDWDDS